MKDRIPKYAGRVKLIPVANQPNIYDMTRADEPLEEGTPLKKATLLSDETATLLGLTGDSNVNDAFGAISRDKVNKSDIIDNLTTTETAKPLSANQGVILNGLVDNNQEAIANIANKFDNGILKIENGGTGSNNLYDAIKSVGFVRTYIGQYEGTGNKMLTLVLPYKPKAILIMAGKPDYDYNYDDNTDYYGCTFGVIEFSKVNTNGTSMAVVSSAYINHEYVRKVAESSTRFDEATNTLDISNADSSMLSFNDIGYTHTYIMFG